MLPTRFPQHKLGRALAAVGLTLAAWLLGPGAVAAEETVVGDARAALLQRLRTLKSYHADFSQRVEGARGQVLEESTGELLLARPKFRWQVDEPYPQIIVTDGDKLSIYDPDLEQVMIRELTTALADTPVALLTQAELALSDDYAVLLLRGVSGEADVFLLTPQREDSLLQELQLHFVGSQLMQLQIYDQLGQSTTVRFRPRALSGAVDASAFQLDLPPHVDVLEG